MLSKALDGILRLDSIVELLERIRPFPGLNSMEAEVVSRGCLLNVWPSSPISSGPAEKRLRRVLGILTFRVTRRTYADTTVVVVECLARWMGVWFF